MVSKVGVESVEYHPNSSTVRTQFDQAKTSASMAVTATLADAMGVDPVEMDPLHSTVDPDALDDLLRVRTGTDGDIHVTFTHENHAITVQSYGVVTITPERGSPAKPDDKETGR